MYPSIIQSKNLCQSTIIDRETCRRYGFVEGEDYIVTPAGHLFVTPKHRESLLKAILVMLTKKRGLEKDLMALAGDCAKAADEARDAVRNADRIEGSDEVVAKLVALHKQHAVFAKKLAAESLGEVADASSRLLANLTYESARNLPYEDVLIYLGLLWEEYDTLRATFNEAQNATKISANSVYG